MKVDFKKSQDSYRARCGEFRVIDVPAMQYLMVDGHGDPNTSKDYADALAALYPVAYKLKFASKRGLGRDDVVPPPSRCLPTPSPRSTSCSPRCPMPPSTMG